MPIRSNKKLPTLQQLQNTSFEKLDQNQFRTNAHYNYAKIVIKNNKHFATHNLLAPFVHGINTLQWQTLNKLPSSEIEKLCRIDVGLFDRDVV